jgi:hypothetical protein
MNRVCPFLFVLFYAASSYAITQERTNLLIGEFQHSSSHVSLVQIDDACEQLHNDFPNYRQAKPKATFLAHIDQAPSIEFLPPLSKPSFHPPTCLLPSLNLRENVLSRAPPSGR